MTKVNSSIFSFLVFIQCFNCKAQYVTIPDTNFVNWLYASGYSGCMNGNLMDTTCNLIINQQYLFVDGAGIQDLTGIQYFDNLHDLDCYNNQLTSLPPLPQTLYWLDCSNNNLIALPSLPTNLFALFCEENQLTSLPSLFGMSDLFYLVCSYNQITSLPNLPQNLGWLHADHNLLTTLPVIPGNPWVNVNSNQLVSIAGWPTGGVNQFDCDSNLLTTLPPFPYLANFGNLRFRHNLLTYIPPLPAYVGYLYIDDNPIACPPKIYDLHFLSWNNTQISCLVSACIIDTASPPITSLSICDPLSGCDFYYNTFGKVYLDYNSNCQFNVNDVRLPDFYVRLDSAGTFKQSMLTMPNGYYSFETDFGSYTTKIGNNYFTNVCPVSGINGFTITAIDSVAENEDFAVKCPATFDLVANSINLNELPRPGRIIPLIVSAGERATFYNVSCFNSGGDVEIILDSSAYYSAPAPGAITPTNVNGDTIRWTIADFSTINPYSSFNILVGIDTNAIFGTDLCVTLNITPVADKDSSNNSLAHCFEIVNSFDPNAKGVFPTGNFDTLTTKWLYYTVYFQNTGNAPAIDIYIIDTLDQYLNASSFSVLSHSHDVITQLLPGNIVKFSFPNINLPDSNSNEPLSHGFVSYKIKFAGNIFPGTFIYNTAYIYFDLNPAVVTNTTISQNVLTGIIQHPNQTCNIQLSPNPFTDEFVVRSSAPGEIKIFDITGKEVLRRGNPNLKDLEYLRISTAHLTPGFYIVNFSGENFSVNKKAVKQ